MSEFARTVVLGRHDAFKMDTTIFQAMATCRALDPLGSWLHSPDLLVGRRGITAPPQEPQPIFYCAAYYEKFTHCMKQHHWLNHQAADSGIPTVIQMPSVCGPTQTPHSVSVAIWHDCLWSQSTSRACHINHQWSHAFLYYFCIKFVTAIEISHMPVSSS